MVLCGISIMEFGSLFECGSLGVWEDFQGNKEWRKRRWILFRSSAWLQLGRLGVLVGCEARIDRRMILPAR